MRVLHRPCPPQTTIGRLSSSPPGHAPPQLRLQSNQATHRRAPRTRWEEATTEVHAATRASLDAIIVAKQKLAPRLSKPRGEDAAIHGEDAAIHQSPSRSRLQNDTPKEEEDAKSPPSPDSGSEVSLWSQTRGEEEHNSTTPLSRKIMAPAGAAVAGSDEDRSKDFSRRCADHLPPSTAAHQSPPAEADLNLTAGSHDPPRPETHQPRPKLPSTTAATHAASHRVTSISKHELAPDPIGATRATAEQTSSLRSTPRTPEQRIHHAQQPVAARQPSPCPAVDLRPTRTSGAEPPPRARAPSTPRPRREPGPRPPPRRPTHCASPSAPRAARGSGRNQPKPAAPATAASPEKPEAAARPAAGPAMRNAPGASGSSAPSCDPQEGRRATERPRRRRQHAGFARRWPQAAAREEAPVDGAAGRRGWVAARVA
ncbi:hypothetical protein VPH35_079403 [Triticum aestivum]|uniref:Uncharacterized protein n=1 Tax=Aegilops tauschii subsp. strangulata TaxID=200361 RepID=A0A453IUI7_AEGTS